MEKFKLSESILADRLILLKRSHEHDEEMWRAIEESRAFIREYLFCCLLFVLSHYIKPASSYYRT